MSVKLYFYCRLEELLQLVLDVCNVLDLNKLVYTICTTILDITHASRYLYLDNRHVAKYVTWSFLRLSLFWRLWLYSLCSSLHCSPHLISTKLKLIFFVTQQSMLHTYSECTFCENNEETREKYFPNFLLNLNFFQNCNM